MSVKKKAVVAPAKVAKPVKKVVVPFVAGQFIPPRQIKNNGKN